MSRPVRPLVLAERWNRKLHYYLGLYFLFFLWLFGLTGLLLNHGQWSLATQANQRQESQFEADLTTLHGQTLLARAREAADQLGLRGEIDLPASQTPGQLVFTVSRPADACQVRVDLDQNRAAVRRFDNNRLGMLRVFHAFSGSRFNQPDSRRDWIVTSVWVFAMDALATGLIVMVLGSYVMWYRLKDRRALGWISVGSGFFLCSLLLRVMF